MRTLVLRPARVDMGANDGQIAMRFATHEVAKVLESRRNLLYRIFGTNKHPNDLRGREAREDEVLVDVAFKNLMLNARPMHFYEGGHVALGQFCPMPKFPRRGQFGASRGQEPGMFWKMFRKPSWELSYVQRASCTSSCEVRSLKIALAGLL